jgi:hypothetical protein
MNNEKRNGILEKMLSGSGDTTVKLVTLALVVVSGGGNLLATKDASRITQAEAERAVGELHTLHGELMDQVQRSKASEQREKEMYAMLQKLQQSTPKPQ